MKKISLLAALAAFVGLSEAQPFAAWTKYREVTINTTNADGGANVASSQANFPVLIRLSNANEAAGSNVLSEALAGGADVRFTDATGATALPHEIEHWSATSAAIWVRVPNVAGNGNTTLRMYWGRTGAAQGSNPAGVFGNNNFLGVWHMGTASGASPRVNAANPGTNDAMPSGSAAASMNPTAGIIGMSDSLRAQNQGQENDDHFDMGVMTFPNTAVTVSMWVNHPNPQNFVAWNHYFTHGNGNLEHNLWFGREDNTNNWRARGAGPTGESGSAGSTTVGSGLIPLAEWMHLAVSKDSTDGMRWRMFRNGEMPVDFMPTSGLENHVFISGVRNFNYIGRSLWPDRNSHIKVDEVRTSAIARSPDWMKLEYETQKLAATAVTLGATQNQTPPALAYLEKDAVYLINQAITTNTAVSSGAASGFSITPNLPAGLSFSTTTGAISGTPTAVSARTKYTINATVGGNPASDTIHITVSAGTPPGAPTGVTATRGNASATVTWTAGPQGTSEITSYIARATQDNTKSCTWTTGPLSCEITGLTNGTSYTFEVQAVSSAGSSPFSAPSAAVTPATVPGSPTNVVLTQSTTTNTTLVATWTPPTATGGSPITDYFGTSTPGNIACYSPPVANPTCNFANLTTGTSYTVTIVAANLIGNSTPSAASNAVVVGGSSIKGGAFALQVTRNPRPFTFALTPEAVKSTEALTMSITDIYGRTVWSKTVRPSQENVRELTWNGRTSTGNAVSAGVYMVKVSTVDGGNTASFIRPATVQ